jgi:hypothetical protein
MAHDADARAHDKQNAREDAAGNADGGTSTRTRSGAGRSGKHWLWLLLLPWIAMIWVPSYNKVEPQLFEFPFFYWYQLLWVLISAVITALVYFKTRSKSSKSANSSASRPQGGAR